MRILSNKAQGLIIDIQERLVPAMHEAQAMLDRTRILIQGLKLLEIPLTVTEQYPKGLGATIPAIRELLESPEFPQVYWPKTSFSCFGDRDIRVALATHAEADRDCILIAGMESHVCVLQTAIDLRQAGFNPVIIADCVASRSSLEKAVALDRFRSEGILVSTAESILFELCRAAGTETFKAISRLVK